MTVLHTIHDPDFELWKNSPEKFLKIHRHTIHGVIADNCFCGHRNPKMLSDWNDLITRVMQSESVVDKLNAYAHQSSFLLFYATVLRDEVAEQSKNEDLAMLHDDYNNLVLKYKPLIEMLTEKMLRYNAQWNLAQEEIMQQVITNLLGKKDYIATRYNNHLPFCKFFWSIIHNEIFNLIRKEIRHLKQESPITGKTAEQFSVEQFSEKNLMIEYALKNFHDRTLTYLERRPKLILCLKTKYKIKINHKNLENLFGVNHGKKDHEVQATLLNDLNHASDPAVRFELLQKFLNSAERTQTEPESYRRWTDQQVELLIDYLNGCHVMTFDPKSFSALVDRYFAKFSGE